jgi:hypothetical protein
MIGGALMAAAMIYSADVDAGFAPTVLDAAQKIGAVDPRELLVILFAESSVTHTADHHVLDQNGNLAARFVGINQFFVSLSTKPGADDTFRHAVPDMGPDAYLSLPASVQLSRYVVPFWGAIRQQHGADATSNARNLYWCNFLPDTFVPGAPDSYVITRNPGIIKHNALLANGKDYITAGDLSRFLIHRQKAESHRWNELLNRVEVAMGLRPDPLGSIFNPSPAKAGIGLGLFLAVGAGAAYVLTRKGT